MQKQRECTARMGGPEPCGCCPAASGHDGRAPSAVGQRQAPGTGLLPVKGLYVIRMLLQIRPDLPFCPVRNGQSPRGDPGNDTADRKPTLLRTCANPQTSRSMPVYASVRTDLLLILASESENRKSRDNCTRWRGTGSRRKRVFQTGRWSRLTVARLVIRHGASAPAGTPMRPSGRVRRGPGSRNGQ